MLIVDAHEDIAWNILTFGRDYTRSARQIREIEADGIAPAANGNTLLGKADWLAGQVAVIFATLYNAPAAYRYGDWDTQYYRDQEEAYRHAQAQLDAYDRLCGADPTFRLISTQADLSAVLQTWEHGAGEADRQIGLVPLMEGADPIRDPQEAHEWFERGVRIVGLSWEATRYAGGTHEPGPLTADGRRLLDVMAEVGMILDISHLAEEACYQALEAYPGPLIASHSNPRRFLPTPRGLTDPMIAMVAERDGVIGIVPYNAFLKPGWRKGDRREAVGLAEVVSAIDHVCQVTGSAAHVGLGSDFDGGFGLEHVPVGLDSVADLQKLAPLLQERGYRDEDVAAILGYNWIRVLARSLPG